MLFPDAGAAVKNGDIDSFQKERADMLAYHEPFMISTPGQYSPICVSIGLHEPVDGELLREAVEELRTRFPYFYVRAARKDGELRPVPNDLPMTVRGTWEPINLNAAASNYHLAAWKYEGKRLAFEIPHFLTDGAGVLPYIKSAMYLYLSKATGKRFDPTGFRLPGQPIPESEIGDPFPNLDIDGAKAPFYEKKPVSDFFRLTDETDHTQKAFYLKLSEEEVMRNCREQDGSPNVFFAALLARAARRYDPASDKTFTIFVSIDHKAILGNHDNYRMFASQVPLDFPKSREGDELSKACTIARGKLMLLTQPENSLWEMKQRKRMLPPPSLDIPQGTMCISYANSRSFGPLDPYIDMTCINGHFFLAYMQPFTSERFLNCFLEELRLAGIGCELLGSEELHLCGIEPLDTVQ